MNLLWHILRPVRLMHVAAIFLTFHSIAVAAQQLCLQQLCSLSADIPVICLIVKS